MQVHGWIATGFRQVLLFGYLCLLFGCSQDGQSPNAFLGGAYADLTGSITDGSGVSSSMEGWFLLLIDRDTAETRIASIDATGGYKFSHAFTSKTYTLQLLSPSSVFRAGLAYPDATNTGLLHPYFTLTSLVLPALVSEGSVITMSSTEGLIFTSDTVTDKELSGIPDTVKNVWGPSFTQYIDWFVAKVSSEIQLDGTTNTYITFYTKLQNNQAAPLTVQVVGASSLLNDAVVQTQTTSGTTTKTWDRLLLNDGLGDGIFLRKILLGTGKLPVNNLMVFLQLTYGSTSAPWSIGFPYTFSGVTFGSIAASYEPITRTVEISGTPFSGIASYTWSVSVFQVNSDGTSAKMFTSPATLGKTSTYVLPSNVLEQGDNYTYNITAQTPDLVSGYPAYTINTLSGTITP